MDKWYETEEDKFYEEAVGRIKDAVVQGMTFEQASGLMDVKEPGLKEAIEDDALKLLVAEMHFLGKTTLREAARKLKLPLERLEAAKKEMLREIEDSAIDAYKTESGQKGNA